MAIIAFGWASTAAHAQMPQKPFSQWTGGEQQQYANHLKQICNSQCAEYVPQSSSVPVQRTIYEAAACQSACFAGHLPADYPGLANMKKSAWDNYNQAKALGSPMPVPTFGR
nr:hypothetical protein [uncultured Rhodopila sp.]